MSILVIRIFRHRQLTYRTCASANKHLCTLPCVVPPGVLDLPLCLLLRPFVRFFVSGHRTVVNSDIIVQNTVSCVRGKNLTRLIAIENQLHIFVYLYSTYWSHMWQIYALASFPLHALHRNAYRCIGRRLPIDLRVTKNVTHV